MLVVDDNSTDGTKGWIEKYFPQVEVLSIDSNLGFCRAVNIGLRHANGEIVELLNNDTEVTSGWADACLKHFADPEVGSVAPLVLQMDAPGKIDSAGQEYHLCGWASARGYGRRLSQQYLQAGEVFGASASCGFYRKSALDHVGGFREEFDAYLEDTDLAFRLRWAGYKCVYEPEAKVNHRGSSSYSANSDRVISLLSRNEEYNFWMNLPVKQLLWGIIPHLGFVGVRALSKLLGGKILPYLQGKQQAWGNRDLICQRRMKLRSRFEGGEANLSDWLGRSPEVLIHGIWWLWHRLSAKGN